MGNKSERQNWKAGTFRLESGCKSTNIFYKLTKYFVPDSQTAISGTVDGNRITRKKLPQANSSNSLEIVLR